ncbi:SDR family NAD(P)-dependent oxidoreductase [Dermatobacter hominis]|uniref:SDR family NAD(P)-dependent oxidoreductase n=1 Tax=Dermatobacter hominis TaxID=2884263 RepID=UPI001D124333|nr:SDR family NAD(P)-dependent oxidoreductase [Dermatobacter hominis]UDY35030.1 SDR family oxidoreductase [Dermatobacter hominis]
MFDPDGARVLVTGASSGLGAALAEGLAERGARLALCARRTDRLDEVLDRVRRHSPGSRAWTVDLADLDGLDAFAAAAVDELGGLDLLVNNAGMPKRRWAWAHRPDEVTAVLRLNVESPIRLTTALLGPLVESAGHVVFVGSVAARLAPPNEAVYAASKAAVTAYAEGLRVDLAIAGAAVGVHVVQPGVLRTELFTTTDDDPSLADVEPLEPSAIVGAVLGALDSGATESFVPDWFADLPAVKAGDVDGFLAGSAEYARQRLEATGRAAPAPPGVAS